LRRLSVYGPKTGVKALITLDKPINVGQTGDWFIGLSGRVYRGGFMGTAAFVML
jgi:hypothetical protein